MGHVLVATDLSERSQPAIRRAAQIAVRLRARLTALHVVDDALPPQIADAHVERAREWLSRTLPADTGLPSAEVLVRRGDPHSQILAAGNEMDSDLIVLGEHRQRLLRDAFLGTTAERLLRVASRPLLVVHRASLEPYRRVHVATDLSAASAHAILTARRLDLLGDRISVVHVFYAAGKGKMRQAGLEVAPIIESERAAASQRLVAFLRDLDLRDSTIEGVLREGQATREILRVMEGQKPELLVLGTRGRSGVKRAVLGSITEALMRNVPCDVLAVPPAA